jgi:hypothetical protein
MYFKGTKRDVFLESVENQKLKNAINEIYRPVAKGEDGGTAEINISKKIAAIINT